jgi:hypothetical protein
MKEKAQTKKMGTQRKSFLIKRHFKLNRLCSMSILTFVVTEIIDHPLKKAKSLPQKHTSLS